MKRLFHYLILAFTVVTVLCGCTGDPEKERAKQAREYVSASPGLQSEKRDAILRGQALVGMAPDEVIAAAAAGQYEILIIRKDPKWPEHSDPHEVVAAQHDNPDATIFRLDFANRTQFQSSQPTVFSVCFKQGRSFRISRTEADMCDSGLKF